MSMFIGEALVGDGEEVAHIDLLIGAKAGPVGSAFAMALANQSKGHTNLLAVIAFYVGGLAPAAPFWHNQAAYDTILGFTPRLLLASFIAYLVGEFTNSFVLAKLKIATRGRWLWTRTIGSTLVGEGLDTLIFISIAFWGIIPQQLILTTILTQWIFKVVYEVVATPFTYAVVGFLKRRENIDTYDYRTNFNPLLFRSEASAR